MHTPSIPTADAEPEANQSPEGLNKTINSTQERKAPPDGGSPIASDPPVRRTKTDALLNAMLHWVLSRL